MSPVNPTTEPHVNDIIGIGNQIEVVFDRNDRGTLLNQAVKDLDQLLNIQLVQAHGWFIKDKERQILAFANL